MADARQHQAAEFCRTSGRFQVRVSIASRKVYGVYHGLKKSFAEFLVGGSAKTDGVSHAFIESNAFMRVLRRQIEHVSGAQYEFLLRLEIFQYLERNAFHQIQIGLCTDTPTTMSMCLQ